VDPQPAWRQRTGPTFSGLIIICILKARPKSGPFLQSATGPRNQLLGPKHRYFFLGGFFFSRFGASLFPMLIVSHRMQDFATSGG
jgi:hypothetical protein